MRLKNKGFSHPFQQQGHHILQMNLQNPEHKPRDKTKKANKKQRKQRKPVKKKKKRKKERLTYGKAEKARGQDKAAREQRQKK